MWARPPSVRERHGSIPCIRPQGGEPALSFGHPTPSRATRPGDRTIAPSLRRHQQHLLAHLDDRAAGGGVPAVDVGRVPQLPHRPAVQAARASALVASPAPPPIPLGGCGAHLSAALATACCAGAMAASAGRGRASCTPTHTTDARHACTPRMHAMHARHACTPRRHASHACMPTPATPATHARQLLKDGARQLGCGRGVPAQKTH